MPDTRDRFDKARERGGKVTADKTRKPPPLTGYVRKGTGGVRYRQQWCYRCNAAHGRHEDKP